MGEIVKRVHDLVSLCPSENFVDRITGGDSALSVSTLAALTASPSDILDWPLHVRNVSRLSYEEQDDVPCDPDVHDRNIRALRPLRDPSFYDSMPKKTARGTPYTVLSSADIRAMIDAGVVCEIDPAEVAGHVVLFYVPEPHKNRRRPIRFTRDINDRFGRDTCVPIDMATKLDIITILRRGDFAIAFDGRCWFDQFLIHKDISRRMCFRKGRRFYRLLTAPMGQRHVVAAAHTTLRKLDLDPENECDSIAIIDNVLKVGDTEDMCIRDGKRFLRRCAAVNADMHEKIDDVETLVTQELEWGGIGLDFKNKTTRLTHKMVDKMRLSWSIRDKWSNRDFCSHMGCLFWTVGIIQVYPGDYFAALQCYGRVCRDFALLDGDDKIKNLFWNVPAVIPDDVMQDLQRWTDRALRNRPRYVPEESVPDAQPDWLVCVDACRTGFGYVALCPRTGKAHHHGQKWPAAFAAKNRHRLHQSVFTEPEGVVMSMCHLLSRTDSVQRIHIWTDSVTTMRGGQKGYNSRSEQVNDALRRLRTLFPEDHYFFSYAHIKGSDNTVADAASRGRRVTFAEVQGAASQMGAMLEGRQPAGRD